MIIKENTCYTIVEIHVNYGIFLPGLLFKIKRKKIIICNVRRYLRVFESLWRHTFMLQIPLIEK